MKSEVKEIEKINWVTETGVKDDSVMCQYLTYVPPAKYNWSMIATAEAQGSNTNNFLSTNNLLSVPLYIVVVFFLIFTVTMSLIYIYHWMKYNLNDPFIKNFSIIYFFGLAALFVPLIFNLII